MAGFGGYGMMRLAMLSLGYGFLGLGVLGLFLPILQGVLFIVVGLMILSRHTVWAGRTLAWAKDRHPRVRQVVGEAERIAEAWAGRMRNWYRRRVGGGVA